MNELITAEDHDAGFKEVEVLFRSGRREGLRLTAPNYRVAQQIALRLSQTRDPLCVTEACLPAEQRPEAERFLSRLTPECGALVEAMAFALTFGSEFQKKMEAAGEQLMQAMGSTDCARNWPSSPPASPPGKSGDSRCPSCDSISGSSASGKSSGSCGSLSSPVAAG